MAVRIVPEQTSGKCADSDYLRVSTCNDPLDDTVTLATIQRFVVKQKPAGAARPVHIKTLVLLQPMSNDQALGLATCYAERKNIQIVYTD